MKVYSYTMTGSQYYGVAENMEDAYERRGEYEDRFNFLDPVITEIEVEGYNIVATPLEGTPVRNKGGRPRKEG